MEGVVVIEVVVVVCIVEILVVVCIDVVVVVDVAVVVCIVGIVVYVGVVVCIDGVAVVVVVGSMIPLNATPVVDKIHLFFCWFHLKIPEAMPPVTMATMVRVSRSLARVASFADLMPVSTQQQTLWSMEKTIPVTNPAANTRGF